MAEISRDIPSVLLPLAPEPGESLMGLVSRVAARNMHGTVAHILAAAKYPHHAHFDMAISRPERLTDLARVLGVTKADLVERFHEPVPTPYRTIRVDFFGTNVMACDLDFRARRICPRTLRETPHHRAIWNHRLVPWCTETGGLVIERCPACAADLRWHRAEGVAVCDACKEDLRQFDSTFDEGLRHIVDPLLDLISPDPARYEPAILRLHPDVRDIGRGAAFELGWTLACAFGGPAGETPRQRQSKLPRDTIVDTLVQAADLLTAWPGCIEDLLASFGRSNDAITLDRTVRRLRADFRPRRSWPELSELVVKAHPSIFTWSVRSRGVVHDFAPGLVGGQEAIRLLGMGSRKFTHLYRSGLVDQIVRSGGERHAFATYDATSLTAASEVFRDRMRVTAAAEKLGTTYHGIEQLICLEVLEEITDARVLAVSLGRQISRSGFEELEADIRRAAVASGDGWVPAYDALKAMGSAEKPYGPLLVAMRDRLQPFALEVGEAPLLARVRLPNRRCLRDARLAFEPMAHPNFLFDDQISRIDAVDVLNLTPATLLKSIAGELGDAKTAATRLHREVVLRMARRRIAAGEIRHRWMEGARKVPEALKPGGPIPRLGPAGWDRAIVEFHMEGARHG